MNKPCSAASLMPSCIWRRQAANGVCRRRASRHTTQRVCGRSTPLSA